MSAIDTIKKDTDYAVRNGKRMFPYIISPNIAPIFIGGVQSFEYNPQTDRQAYGEFGARGDVISIVNYKDVSGSFDTRDLGAKDYVNMVLCGQDPTATAIGAVDWVNIQKVQFFMNVLNKERTKVEKSLALVDVDFGQSYSASLDDIETVRYDYTALRAVEFPNAEIAYQKFAGDGSTVQFDLGEKTEEVTTDQTDAFRHTKALWVILNGVVQKTRQVSVVDVGATTKVTFTTAPASGDFIQVVYLRKARDIDPLLFHMLDGNVIVTPSATSSTVFQSVAVTDEDEVTFTFSGGIQCDNLTALCTAIEVEDASGNMVHPTVCTINTAGTVVCTLPTGTIANGTAGRAANYTVPSVGFLKDLSGVALAGVTGITV